MTTRRLPSLFLLLAAALVFDVATAFAPTGTTIAAKDLRRHLYIDPENRSSPLEPSKSPKTKSGNGRENEKAKDTGAHPGFVQGLTDKAETCTSCIPENVSAKTKKRLERLLSPRPHPVFLLEKATKVAEDSLGGVMSMLLPDKLTSPTSTADASDKAKEKKKLVILGSGWGCAAMVQDRDLTEKFDVTIISPRNHFVYTPMLAGSAVGTVEPRSISEPIRAISRNKATYLEASALSFDQEFKKISCEGMVCDEECIMNDFDVQYDTLVAAVGAQTNTFGIKGVAEHCEFLKEIEHARVIRKKLLNCFERANVPNLSDEERRKLLTFAIIGAGPTGIEFASELADFVEQDVPKYWPHLLSFVSIKLIDANPTVLQPFDKDLQDAAIEALQHRFTTPVIKDGQVDGQSQRSFVELILNQRVNEVTEDTITLSNGREISYSVATWAGGIGSLPITLDIINGLGDQQKDCQGIAKGKIVVDPYLRAIGAHDSSVFAIGDCACVKSSCLPSNAQVASQEGEYLAHLLASSDLEPSFEGDSLLPPSLSRRSLADAVASLATGDWEYAYPFQFLDLGILAYTGKSSALAQVKAAPAENAKMKLRGNIGFAVWRSVYMAKSPSMRNRMLLAFDWAKAKLFGRDITLID